MPVHQIIIKTSPDLVVIPAPPPPGNAAIASLGRGLVAISTPINNVVLEAGDGAINSPFVPNPLTNWEMITRQPIAARRVREYCDFPVLEAAAPPSASTIGLVPPTVPRRAKRLDIASDDQPIVMLTDGNSAAWSTADRPPVLKPRIQRPAEDFQAAVAHPAENVATWDQHELRPATPPTKWRQSIPDEPMTYTQKHAALNPATWERVLDTPRTFRKESPHQADQPFIEAPSNAGAYLSEPLKPLERTMRGRVRLSEDFQTGQAHPALSPAAWELREVRTPADPPRRRRVVHDQSPFPALVLPSSTPYLFEPLLRPASRAQFVRTIIDEPLTYAAAHESIAWARWNSGLPERRLGIRRQSLISMPEQPFISTAPLSVDNWLQAMDSMRGKRPLFIPPQEQVFQVGSHSVLNPAAWELRRLAPPLQRKSFPEFNTNQDYPFAIVAHPALSPSAWSQVEALVARKTFSRIAIGEDVFIRIPVNVTTWIGLEFRPVPTVKGWQRVAHDAMVPPVVPTDPQLWLTMDRPIYRRIVVHPSFLDGGQLSVMPAVLGFMPDIELTLELVRSVSLSLGLPRETSLYLDLTENG